MTTPRYSCIFISRKCPRTCSYCRSKDVRGESGLLSVEQWRDALRTLEQNGVVFHLILGNELFTYPDPVGFVKMMNEFYGRYATYTTFPPGFRARYLDAVIEAGIYNISSGVDVWPGLLTGDKAVDRKSAEALYWLSYCLDHGVPDVQGTVTIHSKNYDKLEPLFDLLTEKKIWIGCSLVEASADGQHEFYGDATSMQEWLIPEDARSKFRDEMYRLATEIRKGRWMMQVPPSYFEEMGDREYERRPWHCSVPILITIEEDGTLKSCGYRGKLGEKWSVFDLAHGGGLSMVQYAALQREKTAQCPGCGVGGGAWSYWWMGERFEELRNLTMDTLGDKVFQIHVPGHEFEELLKDARGPKNHQP